MAEVKSESRVRISKLEIGAAIIDEEEKEFISKIKHPFVCSLRKGMDGIIVETTYFMIPGENKTVTLHYNPIYSPRTVKRGDRDFHRLNKQLTLYEKKNAT